MPFYLYQLAYSGDAIKAMVADRTDREAAARKLVEALAASCTTCSSPSQVRRGCLIEGPDDMFHDGGRWAAVGSAGTVSARRRRS